MRVVSKLLLMGLMSTMGSSNDDVPVESVISSAEDETLWSCSLGQEQMMLSWKSCGVIVNCRTSCKSTSNCGSDLYQLVASMVPSVRKSVEDGGVCLSVLYGSSEYNLCEFAEELGMNDVALKKTVTKLAISIQETPVIDPQGMQRRLKRKGSSGEPSACSTNSFSNLESFLLRGNAGIDSFDQIMEVLNEEVLQELALIDLKEVDINTSYFKSFLNLRLLWLQNVTLSGNLAQLNRVTGLKTLRIKGTTLESEIPDWVWLQNLESLVLTGDNFIGTIPKSLGSLTNLKLLHMENMTNLTQNVIPTFIGESLTNLHSLTMQNVGRIGPVPKSLENLNNLALLDLSHNTLSGPFPQNISLNPFLWLDVSSNSFNGTFYYPIMEQRGTFPPFTDTSNNRFSEFQIVKVPEVDGNQYLNNSHLLQSNIPKTGLRFDSKHVSCTCNYFQSLWNLSQTLAPNERLHVSDDTTCIFQSAPTASFMKLKVRNFAGGPCLQSNRPVVDVTDVNFGAENVTVEWATAPSFDAEIDEDEEWDTISHFMTCDGCKRFQLAIDDSLFFKKENRYDRKMVYLAQIVDVGSNSCCMALPRNLSSISMPLAIPYGNKVTVSVTAAYITSHSISMSGEPDLLMDFAATSFEVRRPSDIYMETDANGFLVLRFTPVEAATNSTFNNETRNASLVGNHDEDKLDEDGDDLDKEGDEDENFQHNNDGVVSLIIERVVSVIDTTTGDEVINEVLNETSGSFNVGLRLKAIAKASTTFNVEVYETKEFKGLDSSKRIVKTVFSTKVSTFTKDVLQKCGQGKGVNQSDSLHRDCTWCPIGTYSAANELTCAQCPYATTTAKVGSTSVHACNISAEGYFYDPTVDAYRHCPSACDCAETGSTLENMKLHPGWWRPSTTSMDIYWCPRPSLCDGDWLGLSCSNHSYGPLCLLCEDGYVRKYTIEDTICTKCTEADYNYEVAILLVWVGLIILLVMAPFGYLKYRVHLLRTGSEGIQCCSSSRPWMRFLQNCVWNKTCIAIGFFQVYMVFARHAIQDDLPLHPMFVPRPGVFACLFIHTYQASLLFYTIPLIAFVTSLTIMKWIASKRRLPRATMERIRVDTWNIMFFIFWLLYPGICSMVVGAFGCVRIGDQKYLRSDITTQCDGDHRGNYIATTIYAGMMLVILVAGILVLISYRLFLRRNLLRMEMWTPQEKERVADLKFLYFPYHNRAYWFEAYDMARKFILTAGIVLLIPGLIPDYIDGHLNTEVDILAVGLPQVLFALLMNVTGLFALQFFQPYRNRFDLAFASISLANLAGIAVAILILKSSSTHIGNLDRISWWTTLGILIFELVMFLVLCIYDIVHLGQYPDREDEMRVKIKRNFYHSAVGAVGYLQDGLVKRSMSHQHEQASPMAMESPTFVKDLRMDYVDKDVINNINNNTSQFFSSGSCAFVLPQTPSNSELDDPFQSSETSISVHEQGSGDSIISVSPADSQTSTLQEARVEPTAKCIINGKNVAIGSHNLVKFGILGSGGSGSVHIGICMDTFDLLAVKEVSIYDEAKTHQAIHEIKALRALSSDCQDIMGYYGTYLNVESHLLCMVLEYCDGGTLKDFFAPDEPNDPSVTNIFKFQRNIHATDASLATIAFDILSALTFIHDRGYVHLDIKPSNILLDGMTGRAKLGDFGLAHKLDDDVEDGEKSADVIQNKKLCGTIKYLSPERLHGDRATPMADIWSFGLSILAAKLGRYPIDFQGDTSHDLYWHLIERMNASQYLVVDEMSEMEPELQDFFKQSLRIEPDVRSTAQVLLKHSWITSNQHKRQNRPAIRNKGFEVTSVLLEKITQALMFKVSSSASQGEGPTRREYAASTITTLTEDDDDEEEQYGIIRHRRRVGYMVSMEQLDNICRQLNLSREIVKYSFIVSGDAAHVNVSFETDCNK